VFYNSVQWHGLAVTRWSRST